MVIKTPLRKIFKDVPLTEEQILTLPGKPVKDSNGNVIGKITNIVFNPTMNYRTGESIPGAEDYIVMEIDVDIKIGG